MEIDDNLRPMLGGDRVAEFHARVAIAYEEKIVKAVLEYYGLLGSISTLKNMAKDKTGHAHLTLGWFHDLYSGFPVWLHARKIPYVHELTVPHLFKGFEKTKLFDEWLESKSEAPEHWPAALIFDWAGVPGSHMVLHDYNHGCDANDTVIQYVDAKGNSLFLGRLNPWLAQVTWDATSYSAE